MNVCLVLGSNFRRDVLEVNEGVDNGVKVDMTQGVHLPISISVSDVQSNNWKVGSQKSKVDANRTRDSGKVRIQPSTYSVGNVDTNRHNEKIETLGRIIEPSNHVQAGKGKSEQVSRVEGGYRAKEQLK